MLDDTILPAKKIKKNKIIHENKYKIALYHGSIYEAKTDTKHNMTNKPITTADFNGYDYVMLGDIHKHQYLNEEQTIAYAGSLIQQNHGESLKGHGFLKWDLLKSESELFEIENDYGFCTLEITDGKLIKSKIPPKPYIRFILEKTNDIQYQEILNEIEKKYLIQGITKKYKVNTKIHENISLQDNDIKSDINNNEAMKSHLTKKGFNKKEIKKIIKLHNDISKKVFEENPKKIFDYSKNQNWKILELKFSNVLSYGENNVIDFRNYKQNEVIGIMAPNHYGKSAILDIILFCLFDKFTRGYCTDIINKNTDENTGKMFCSLLLGIGSKQYLIERISKRSETGINVKIDVKFSSIEIINGKEIKKNLGGTTKPQTNKKIIKLVGNYNNYLATCICLQQGDTNNFSEMTANEKKTHLNNMLNLNIYKFCCEYAKNELKTLNGIIGTIEKNINMVSIDNLKNKITETSNQLKQLKHTNKNNKYILEYITKCKNILMQPPLIQYNELSKYNLQTEKDIITTIDNLNKVLNETIDTHSINTNLKNYKKQLKKLKNNENDESNLQKLRNKEKELLKQLVNISEENTQTTLGSLRDESIKIQSKINKIKKILQKQNTNDKVDDLKYKIMQLNNLLKSNKMPDDKVESELTELKTKLGTKVTLFIKYLDLYCKHGYIDQEKKNKILHELQIRNEYKNHINNNITDLKSCINDTQSKETIQKLLLILDRETNLLSKTKETNKNLRILNDANMPDMSKLLHEITKLQKKISLWYIDFVSIREKENIKSNINILQKKLNDCEKITDLRYQKILLEEELKQFDDKINKKTNEEQHIKKKY